MRPILKDEDKKISITISVDNELLKQIKTKNKSELINHLLRVYFDLKKEF